MTLTLLIVFELQVTILARRVLIVDLDHGTPNILKWEICSRCRRGRFPLTPALGKYIVWRILIDNAFEIARFGKIEMSTNFLSTKFGQGGREKGWRGFEDFSRQISTIPPHLTPSRGGGCWRPRFSGHNSVDISIPPTSMIADVKMASRYGVVYCGPPKAAPMNEGCAGAIDSSQKRRQPCKQEKLPS